MSASLKNKGLAGAYTTGALGEGPWQETACSRGFIYSLVHSEQLNISNETPKPGLFLKNFCKERHKPRRRSLEAHFEVVITMTVVKYTKQFAHL